MVSLPARGQSSPDPAQPPHSEPRCSGFGNEGSSGRGSCASLGSRNSGGGGVLKGRVTADLEIQEGGVMPKDSWSHWEEMEAL